MRFNLFPPQAMYEFGGRENQEDMLYPQHPTADDRLFIVCDGMGGLDRGEVASQTVCDVVSQYISERFKPDDVFTPELLNAAIDAAYARLNEVNTNPDRRMGTTLTLVCFHRGGVMAAHIGDSRIYHLRPKTLAQEGEIMYMSRDHSLVNDLFEANEITYFAETRTHPRKNMITRAMMPIVKDDDRKWEPKITYIKDVKPGDYFLLCSDGVLEQMTDLDVLDFVSQDIPNEEKISQLVDMTQKNHDNHTALLIQVESVTAEASDADQPDNEKANNYYTRAQRIEAENVKEMETSGVEVMSEHAAPTMNPAPQSAPMQPQQAVPKNNSKRNTLIAIIIVAMLIIAALVAVLFLTKSKKANEESDEKSSAKAKSEMVTEAPTNTEVDEADDMFENARMPEDLAPDDKATGMDDAAEHNAPMNEKEVKEKAENAKKAAENIIKNMPNMKQTGGGGGAGN